MREKQSPLKAEACRFTAATVTVAKRKVSRVNSYCYFKGWDNKEGLAKSSFQLFAGF